MADLFVLSNNTAMTLYKWDGASWLTHASMTNPQAASDAVVCGLFRAYGKLKAVYVQAGGTLTVADVSAAGVVNIEDTDTGWSSTERPRLSNFINYRGKIYALLCGESAGTALLFTYDPATATFTLTDIETLLHVPSTAPNGQYSAACASRRLLGYRDRILIAKYGHNDDGNTGHWSGSNHIHAFDPLAPMSIQNYLWGNNGTFLEAVRLSSAVSHSLADIRRVIVGVGQYNDKLYVMRADGAVCEFDPETGMISGTPIFNMQSHSSMQSTGLATGATSPNGIILPTATYNALSAHMLGAEVTCDGQTGTVVGMSGTTNGTLYVRDSAGNPIANLTASALLDVKLGFIPSPEHGASNYGAFAICHMFQIGTYFYVLIGASQEYVASGRIDMPLLLARWNGSAVSFLELTYSGFKPSCINMVVVPDQDNDDLHILFTSKLAAATQVLRHIRVDLSTFTKTGELEVATEATYNGTYQVSNTGINTGAALEFSYDQPDVEITGVVYDDFYNLATISYKLYDESSDDADISVQADLGNGWQECTEAAGGEGKYNLSTTPSGAAHTFIHDIGADGGSALPRIQYRIKATAS